MSEFKASSSPTETPRSPWLPAIYGFGLTAAIFLGLYWSTAASLVHIWAHSGMFQYAFLIFPISLWLVWNKRREVALGNEPAVCRLGIVLLILSTFIWFLGRIAGVNLLQHIAFVATFPILVLIFFGVPVAKTLAFPLAYLVFAIPVGQSMVSPLQSITAKMSVKFLQLTGIPVLLEGHFITTPSTVWHVAEACSGIRFLVACTALGCLFAYLMFTTLWRRLVFILASMIVPIIANGLRVYFTILIGENFGIQYATGTDHLIFGWQFFGTVLFLLFLVGWFLRQPLPQVTGKNVSPTSDIARTSWRRVFSAAAVAIILLIAAPVAAAWMLHEGTVARKPVVVPAPAGVRGWLRLRPAEASWQPTYHGADRILKAGYTSGTNQVALFAAVYQGAPVAGHDLLAHGNTLFQSARWARTSRATHRVKLTDREPFTVHEVVLTGAMGNRLVWYWYRVNKGNLPSPMQVKAWQAWEQLAGARLTSSVVAVSTHFHRGDLARAKAALKHFTTAFYSRIDRVR